MTGHGESQIKPLAYSQMAQLTDIDPQTSNNVRPRVLEDIQRPRLDNLTTPSETLQRRELLSTPTETPRQLHTSSHQAAFCTCCGACHLA